MAGFALGWWWRAGKEPVGRVEGPEVMPESEQTVLLGGTLAASSGAPEEEGTLRPGQGAGWASMFVIRTRFRATAVKVAQS